MIATDAQNGRIERPRSLWWWLDDSLLYCFTGSITGAAAGFLAACVLLAYEQVCFQHELDDIFGFVVVLLIVVSLGAGVGCVCGLALYVIGWIWPASKHPVRCGVMCASLGGTLWLLRFAIALHFPPVNLDISLSLAGALSSGAFWGFATSWIVQAVVRRWH